jgi:hypothetical protein
MNLAKETLPGTGGAVWGKKWGKINLPPVYLTSLVLFFLFTTEISEMRVGKRFGGATSMCSDSHKL